MAAPQGIVRMHRAGQTVVFQVEGRGTMTQAHSFRRCADQSLAEGVTSLRIDLSHCTHMDSTFIGTLLCLKRDADRRGGCQVALISPSTSCTRLLKQMAVTDLFPLLDEAALPGEGWTDLPCGPEALSTIKTNVEQAHVELAALSGPASEAFRDVVRCLNKARETERENP
jgi:anti-anti-sigma regulatory factor